ncbi:6-aminohexanoate-dimer hydrolase [Ktedonobacteria bacterium brp13]|nr:6-aminohexanoate-dimer hydrolase [Ktedonobacteria bacterium brp13]
MSTFLQREYWPTNDWLTCEPQAVGFQQAMLMRMQEHIQEQLPGLHSLLIVRHGYLAFEHYYQGFHQHSLNSISSATKSVISMLMGVALQQGLLTDLNQHMLDFFPHIAEKEQDSRKKAVTLRHLMSFQSGFTEEYPYQFWLDPVLTSVLRPMVEEPGTHFFYDNLSVDILSGILTKVTGVKAAAFAMDTLFKTLGIWRDEETRFAWQYNKTGPHTWHEDGLWDEQDDYPWRMTCVGTNTGSFGAHFTTRDMAKLGFLYLNHGQWNGTQLVPQGFITKSTRKQSDGGAPVYASYGYLWWIEESQGYHAFFASGFGGKYIYVVPELDLIVVTTASTEQGKIDHNQHSSIKALISNFILPALND